MTDLYKPTAYLLLGCPFCFKFLLFLTEAGLLDQLNIISLDPNAEDFETNKMALQQRADKPLSYPAVEMTPGVFQTETDQLIAHFAENNAIALDKLSTLAYYQQGVFSKYIELFMENRALKAAQTE